MKKLTLFTAVIALVSVLTSCGPDDYQKFVGVWGVERLDYYNIDYAGNPIESTIETYTFTPGDQQSGIDLVFRDNRTGEMRDRSRDTLLIGSIVEGDTIIDTIPCPDTTFVTKFTYSYHEDDNILYMNMQTTVPYTYNINIESFSNEKFVYTNKYLNDPPTVEKAYLVRLSQNASGAKSSKPSKPVKVPNKPGSMFGSR